MMSAVAVMHKQVHERTGQKQGIGQYTQRMSPVVFQDPKCHCREQCAGHELRENTKFGGHGIPPSNVTVADRSEAPTGRFQIYCLGVELGAGLGVAVPCIMCSQPFMSALIMC